MAEEEETSSREKAVGSPQLAVAEFLQTITSSGDFSRTPSTALIPWVCDVLSSEASLKAYARDLSQFASHMGRLGISATDVTADHIKIYKACLLYTSPSPRDATLSRMPSSA